MKEVEAKDPFVFPSVFNAANNDVSGPAAVIQSSADESDDSSVQPQKAASQKPLVPKLEVDVDDEALLEELNVEQEEYLGHKDGMIDEESAGSGDSYNDLVEVEDMQMRAPSERLLGRYTAAFSELASDEFSDLDDEISDLGAPSKAKKADAKKIAAKGKERVKKTIAKKSLPKETEAKEIVSQESVPGANRPPKKRRVDSEDLNYLNYGDEVLQNLEFDVREMKLQLTALVKADTMVSSDVVDAYTSLLAQDAAYNGSLVCTTLQTSVLCPPVALQGDALNARVDALRRRIGNKRSILFPFSGRGHFAVMLFDLTNFSCVVHDSIRGMGRGWPHEQLKLIVEAVTAKKFGVTVFSKNTRQQGPNTVDCAVYCCLNMRVLGIGGSVSNPLIPGTHQLAKTRKSRVMQMRRFIRDEIIAVQLLNWV